MKIKFLMPLLGPASLEVLGAHARRHAAAVTGRLRAAHEAEAVREPRHLVTTRCIHYTSRIILCLHTSRIILCLLTEVLTKETPRKAVDASQHGHSRQQGRACHCEVSGTRATRGGRGQKAARAQAAERVQKMAQAQVRSCAGTTKSVLLLVLAIYSNRYRRSAFKRIARQEKRTPRCAQRAKPSWPSSVN